MNIQSSIIVELERNRPVFQSLFAGVPREQFIWKQAPEKWCLLEVLCHLVDEEREDFRARVRSTLETPEVAWDPIDPPGWVTNRKYMEQDYEGKLEEFLKERTESVRWLRSLSNPKWDNAFVHPKFGPHTARMVLSNWLAHDYLHFRQITRLRYDYLKQTSGDDLGYAGTW